MVFYLVIYYDYNDKYLGYKENAPLHDISQVVI